ncbi:unnamed protein product, partial [Aphanomyces euteiches]
ERKLHEQEITKLRDSIIADKLTIKSADELVKLKAEAHLYPISALSSNVIQELPSDSDPYAYYRLVIVSKITLRAKILRRYFVLDVPFPGTPTFRPKWL